MQREEREIYDRVKGSSVGAQLVALPEKEVFLVERQPAIDRFVRDNELANAKLGDVTITRVSATPHSHPLVSEIF